MEESRTVSISIKRHPDDVYDYLADPANFPEWSVFIKEIRREGSEWIATTPEGTVRIRFAPKNEFRVLDHTVTVSPQLQAYVPMRVLASRENDSVVIFTVFRLPGMSDEEFKDDIRLVLTDLTGLKRVLEDKEKADKSVQRKCAGIAGVDDFPTSFPNFRLIMCGTLVIIKN